MKNSFTFIVKIRRIFDARNPLLVTVCSVIICEFNKSSIFRKR